MKIYWLTLLATLIAAPAAAADTVALTSEVFVEKVEVKDGERQVTLAPPSVVVPGDRLVFALAYHNAGAAPATDFVVTNPMPPAVAFDGSDDPAALVSIDGGKSYGALGALKVRLPDGGERPATNADVTHIRWTFPQPIPAGARGKLGFRGTVK
jgi:uncharacterized repeat protein (TIGR01451 family)